VPHLVSLTRKHAVQPPSRIGPKFGPKACFRCLGQRRRARHVASHRRNAHAAANRQPFGWQPV